MKTCPICAEEIQDAAIKCRFCGGVQPLPGQKVSLVVERPLFEKGGVVVTNLRANLAGRSIPLGDVYSATVRGRRVKYWELYAAMLVVGLLGSCALAIETLAGVGVVALILVVVGAVRRVRSEVRAASGD